MNVHEWFNAGNIVKHFEWPLVRRALRKCSPFTIIVLMEAGREEAGYREGASWSDPAGMVIYIITNRTVNPNPIVPQRHLGKRTCIVIEING